jgi:hypothetical protein
MKKYFKYFITLVVMLVVLGLVGYAWQNLPWYYDIDDSLNTIIIVAATAAFLMGIDKLIDTFTNLIRNYKLVIKLEKIEIPEIETEE